MGGQCCFLLGVRFLERFRGLLTAPTCPTPKPPAIPATALAAAIPATALATPLSAALAAATLAASAPANAASWRR